MIKFNASQTARMLGISNITLFRWLRKGKVNATKGLNGYWEFSIEEINKMLNEYENDPDKQKKVEEIIARAKKEGGLE